MKLLALALASLSISFVLLASQASAQTCGTGRIRDKSGSFLFKPRAAHFNNNSVIVAPKNNFDPISNTENITSVSVRNVNTKNRLPGLDSLCKIKSNGACPPGYAECLYAPTYLCHLTGYGYKRKYGRVIVRLTYKNPVLGKVDGVDTLVSCEDFLVSAPECRTPCNPISIKRPGEYHDPRCSLKYPKCLSQPEKRAPTPTPTATATPTP